LALYKFIY